MKVKDLKPAGYNPRKISREKLSALKKSLEEFGDLSGIVYNTRTQTLIGGHQRIKNLDPSWPIIKKAQTDKTGTTAAGYVETPHGHLTYREVDWPEIKEKQANIAANAHGGEFDEILLKDLLQEIKLEDPALDIELLGFDEKEINEIMALGEQKETRDAEPQIDRAEELNKVWKVKSGDLWQIGSHRLLCGDSTKAEDVARVMGGEKADMVFTDPPYGINLDVNTDVRNRSTPKFRKPNQKSYQPIAGDDADYLPEHIFRDFGNVKEIFLWGADYYAERIPEKNQGCFFVWDKRQESSDAMIGSAFELCWSKTKHKREIIRVLWCGLLGTESQDVRKRIHPTQKPLQLCNWFFEKFSKQDDIIIDLFLGSGTTMVACQNLNRKCRGIEISPDYCAVILQRMTDAFPGIEIKRIGL